MRLKQQLSRVITLCVAASMLAACGGGGQSGGMLPTGGSGSSVGTPSKSAPTTFHAFIPSAASSSSNSKRPDYISSQGTSSLVVSVVPTDPAEAAQWSTLYGAAGFTVCYNIFTAGAIASPLAPGVSVTAVAGGYDVNFPFPSPPGQDTFTITQYVGACSATNPYAAPTAAPSPVPTLSPAQLIISQSPPLVVNIVANANPANNFNVQLSACNTPPGAGPVNQPGPVTCAVPNPPGTTTITPTLGATIAFVYLAQSTPALPLTLGAPIPLPIAEPMREQAVFTSVAADKVGFPLPVVGLTANGYAIPYTAPMAPNTTPSSGLLPKATDSIVVKATETDVSGANHFVLELVDATTGAVAQTSATGGAGITLHSVNGLACTPFPADCSGGGANGDPYVLMATFDGTSASFTTSITVTLAATLSGVAQATQTLTIAPQGSLFTAVAAGPANGYTDTAAPYTAAADIVNIPSTAGNVTAAGQGYWVTDGGSVHQVGGATYAVAGATTLTGMTLFNNTALTAGQILAVDHSQVATPASGGPFAAGSAVPISSGVYVFDPVAHTSKPLAVQFGAGNYIAFAAPQAIAFVGNPTPPGYAYVEAGGNIYAIDLTGNGSHGLQTDASTNFYLADLQLTPVPVTGLNAGTDTGFDMFAGSTAGTLVLADTGNSRIVSVNVTTGAVTVIASGHPFVGLSVNGTGYVATDTAGQIYTITSAGVVTSLGLSNAGAPKDGVVGVLGTTPLAPIPYTTQGQAGNFFGTASVPTIPYNIAPFTAAGPVFTVAPPGIVPDTSNATFGATAGVTTSGFGIAFIPAAPAPTTTALTAGSYLFTDKGALRTLVP
jgi:hypothetical protein